MMFDTDRLFTIGQFAKLHEINKKTLMWYDETGILKPAVIKENGYRYYTFQQSSLLETILMLRELGVSLAEIQHFLQNRSAAALETLLADKIRELDDTMAHLRALRAVMSEKRQYGNDLHDGHRGDRGGRKAGSPLLCDRAHVAGHAV